MAIDPSLSPRIIVGNDCAKPNSKNKFLNQRTSCATLDKAMYSASVVDRQWHGYLRPAQVSGTGT